MKVFCVITERDGDTTKSPGRTETDIHRVDRRFAAETIERVWEEARLYLRTKPLWLFTKSVRQSSFCTGSNELREARPY